MSKETREHLSALVDGEISRETSRFLVRRLGADEEMRGTWTRYHLVRDCLRYQEGSLAGDDLCARVRQKLEQEGTVSLPRKTPARWLKPVAGMAIAASVALMAVVAVGPGAQGVPRAGEGVAGETAEPFTSPQGFSPAPVSSQASFSNQGGSRSRNMDSYLLRHYQAAGSTGGKGFVTFVPIVITSSTEAAAGEDRQESRETGQGEDRDPQ